MAFIAMCAVNALAGTEAQARTAPREGDVRVGDARVAIVPSGRPAGRREARHDVHVTVSRVVLEQGTLYWRVRCFADDLTLAMRALSGDSTFAFSTVPSAANDSLFMRYFRSRVQVDADGARTTPRLMERGTEQDEAGGPVRWYVLAFPVPAAAKALRIRHALLFDVFRDQQNLVTLLDAASGKRQPLYFTAGNDVPQVVTR
jgi:hypothetical protein